MGPIEAKRQVAPPQRHEDRGLEEKAVTKRQKQQQRNYPAKKIQRKRWNDAHHKPTHNGIARPEKRRKHQQKIVTKLL